VSQIAEIFVAERVIPHVLKQTTAIGKSMGLLQIVGGCVGEALGKEWLDVIFPKKINDLFMREDRIGAAHLRQSNEQPDTDYRSPRV